MKKVNLFILLFTLIANYSLIGQDQNQIQEINKSIWDNFTKAFETYDVDLFSSLHSKDFVRISGDSKTIRDVNNYIEGYRNRWQNLNKKQTIDFRFTERINNGNLASEKGIYKLTINIGEPNEVSYYGAFHVVIRKENSNWKLLVDYDSNPENYYGEKSFLEASPK
jgi:ketosteroid isomerase-like protein